MLASLSTHLYKKRHDALTVFSSNLDFQAIEPHMVVKVERPCQGVDKRNMESENTARSEKYRTRCCDMRKVQNRGGRDARRTKFAPWFAIRLSIFNPPLRHALFLLQASNIFNHVAL
jgi:hypothetical protein